MTTVLKRFRTVLLYLWVRVPRLRALLTPTAAIAATAAVFAPAAYADGPDDFKPGGIGDMMPSPTRPDGQGTLFETYEPDVYQLDRQLSDDLFGGDLIDGWLLGVGNILLTVLSMIGRAAVVVTGWCFNVVSLPEVEGAIAGAIGAAAGPMMTVFMPTAVAVGMFIAWARRADNSMLGQLAWVFASAAIATTFLVAPQTWVQGVDNGRQLGADVAMTTIGSAMGSQGEAAMPFKTPEPTWSSGPNSNKDNTVRRAQDAVWRTYVAVPWCIADLGSINACKKWGPEVVKRGTDMEDREKYLSGEMDEEAAGKEAVKWRQGHTPGPRIGVIIAALISAIIFCALVVTLAFATLASLLGALMLLVCGVCFATLWCIPGKPRQWGVQWFEMLIGLIVVSFSATMLLGTVMVVSVSLMSLLPTYGWLMTSALNIVCAVMAFKVKGRLDGIVSAGGAQMAGRGILSTVGRMAQMRKMGKMLGGKKGGGMGDMDRHPPTSTRGPDMPSGDGTSMGSASSATRTHQTRTFPPPPSRPGAGGDYAAEKGTIERLDRQGPAPQVGRPELAGGAHDPAAARRAKAEIAGRKAGDSGPAAISGPRPAGPGGSSGPKGPGRPGAGNSQGSGYAVRPGAPRRTGVPDQKPQAGDRVIQGTVIKKGEAPANPVGAKFRQYPPAGAPVPARGTPRTPGGAAGRAPVNGARSTPQALPPGNSGGSGRSGNSGT
ncbi:hypothetical protein ACFV9E_03340 [Streptomyces sp. NPDC059835]|uniref:hypothetical protein n=1 Tax=Streptomyces sp. NPDC059835 TaxID=3346967 RepID=UPI00365576A8